MACIVINLTHGPINETTWLAHISTDSAVVFVGEGWDMCHITAIFGLTDVSLQYALIGRSLSYSGISVN